MKSLVIVESPAKAKTIHKILGNDFLVKASIGHVKDLPSRDIGIDVDNDFTPKYVVIPGKEKVIRELKTEAARADSVFIATDPDREGEAIAYHIAEEIRSTAKDQVYRVIFNEITARAVRDAVSHPGRIDPDKVDAQQARRVLDRLVGYGLSPYLWKTVSTGLSAGRVQSVAVRLIVDREREIGAFLKEEYWTIEADFLAAETQGTEQPGFRASLFRLSGNLVINRDGEPGKRFFITNTDQAESIVADLSNKDFFLAGIEKKSRKRSPYPPFITSTLQQEAARKLRFSAKKTMMVAQQLYEGIELGSEGAVGLITYMRTDSFRVSQEAQEWGRAVITERFGKEYIPEKPAFYKSKDNAQDAHEAIRPTYREKSPENVRPFLSKDQYSLYLLVWNRFIASQMSPALLEQTTFMIGCRENGVTEKDTEFRTTGTVVKFPGFMALYTESADEIEEEEGGILPKLKEGIRLALNDMKASQHFTQPPPRYSEATLVRTLEEKGIGRPSTYATILSTIQDRKYIEKKEGRFFPTELGAVVNDLLVEKFPDLLDARFTAKMEGDLDAIEKAKLNWVKVIGNFFTPFQKTLKKAYNEGGKIKPEDISTTETCEKCGKPMVIRWGRHGRFLACTGFPQCKNAKPLNGSNGNQEPESAETDEICDKCKAKMLIRSGRFGKFLACSNYPACKSTRPIASGIKCPEDGGDIVERKTKQGKSFWSCSNFPKCTFATWNRPVPKPCPRCSAPLLVVKTNKNKDTILTCLKKECGYTEEAQGNGA